MEFETAVNMESNSRDDAPPSALSISYQLLILPPPPRAPVLQHNAAEARLYWDRSHYSSPAEQMAALTRSATLYVGNLAFTTRTAHVYGHFSQLGGPVKRVVMGLDRLRKTPCGFCFVEYFHRRDAVTAVSMLSGTKLDGQIVRVELDAGFQPGRQYGRGISGGQVRDDVAKRNANNKRERIDSEYSGTTTNNNNSKQRTSSSAPLPVSLDGALPSARNETKAGYNDPSSAGGDNEDNKMDEDDAPSAKRQKRE